jgi:ADP-ribosylglycohydrolase
VYEGLYANNLTARFAPCAWTDDTDQALLIVLSYLHNYTNTRSKTIRPTRVASANKKLTDEFAFRLKVWISQGLLPLNRHACGIGALVGSIAKSERFLEDPIRLATYKWEKGGRNAAPNGSLMRTHPIGIIGFGLTEEETWRLAVDVGSTTHADPRCKVACCI